MAEFPKIEEMSKSVAEKALDEFLYKGKSIREWIKIIASEDAISRKELDKALYERFHEENTNNITNVCLGAVRNFVRSFPPVNPQEPCSNCCNGNQIEKAELCQKSYLAGMEYKQVQCDDAISRRMVLDATVNKNSIWNNITNAKGENLEKIILQLPSVNQLNKWIGAEVLDNIRAEIESLKPCQGCFYDGITRCLEIIDKYKAESED